MILHALKPVIITIIQTPDTPDVDPQCTHTYDHISQQLQSLADAQQQHTVYTKEMDASLFTTDTFTPCTFNITTSDLETDNKSNQHNNDLKTKGIHFCSKHKYRNTVGDSHIQYHDFDSGDTLTFADKYTALLQQELQNSY